MRVLLSTIGSRGDVQPLVALARQLLASGQEVHLCVPPDFQDWITSLGMSVIPIGPKLRSTGKASPSAPRPTPEQMRQMAEASVAGQFETIMQAAQACDVLVGATALQIAAPSVAEKKDIPYHFAAYCPAVLPSRHHAPPVLGLLEDAPAPTPSDNARLWAQDAERFNLFRAPLNSHRAALGLAPITDVRGHIFTSQPWLAADAVLAPWPEPDDASVFQTGAWILPDERRLSAELEAFLDAGDPPIYFGFGSNRTPDDISQTVLNTARSLGRRALISQGWAELSILEDEPDCLVIGETNIQELFKRVAAVVHHGGAGTTTLAALAGAPQVILPQMYDQYYWAERVRQLGIGTALIPGTPTIHSLADALQQSLQPDVSAQAQSLAVQVRTDGAQIAARHLIAAS
ncbi:MAG: glycosyltransferase [Anaerolineales bacterium]